MKIWHLVWIYYFASLDEIQFRSTDPRAEAMIVNTAKQEVPGCTYSSNPESREGGRIHHLNKRGYEIQWTILSRLGRDGWEPFAVDNSVIFLRKEVQKVAETP